MSIEAGVVIGKNGEPLYWHVPQDRSTVALPDSRNLWDVLWEHRHDLAGFAHSHPGSGVPWPSHTDLTTFAAVEAGLGTRLDWWIMSETSIGLYKWQGPNKLDYRLRILSSVNKELILWTWCLKLKELSGYA